MKTIFLHGLGQTPESWNAVISRFGADPVCPDLFAPFENDVSFPTLYDSLFEFLDSQTEPFNLCGLSLGAVAALKYAVEKPEKLGKLALIAAQYKTPKALIALQNLMFRFMPEKNFESVGLSKADFMKLCRSTAEVDLSGGLGNVSCPVLLLCGSEDKVNLKASEKLEKLLPDAKLKIIENAGHELNSDAPEALAGALAEFFKR